jgi:hypothetical protein
VPGQKSREDGAARAVCRASRRRGPRSEGVGGRGVRASAFGAGGGGGGFSATKVEARCSRISYGGAGVEGLADHMWHSIT